MGEVVPFPDRRKRPAAALPFGLALDELPNGYGEPMEIEAYARPCDSEPEDVA